MSVVPIIAREVLDVGVAGLGVLTSASGIGALLGSAVLVGWSKKGRRGLLLVAVVIGFGLALWGWAGRWSSR